MQLIRFRFRMYRSVPAVGSSLLVTETRLIFPDRWRRIGFRRVGVLMGGGVLVVYSLACFCR